MTLIFFMLALFFIWIGECCVVVLEGRKLWWCVVPLLLSVLCIAIAFFNYSM